MLPERVYGSHDGLTQLRFSNLVTTNLSACYRVYYSRSWSQFCRSLEVAKLWFAQCADGLVRVGLVYRLRRQSKALPDLEKHLSGKRVGTRPRVALYCVGNAGIPWELSEPRTNQSSTRTHQSIRTRNMSRIPTGSGLIRESQTSLKIRIWWNERHARTSWGTSAKWSYNARGAINSRSPRTVTYLSGFRVYQDLWWPDVLWPLCPPAESFQFSYLAYSRLQP